MYGKVRQRKILNLPYIPGSCPLPCLTRLLVLLITYCSKLIAFVDYYIRFQSFASLLYYLQFQLICFFSLLSTLQLLLIIIVHCSHSFASFNNYLLFPLCFYLCHSFALVLFAKSMLLAKGLRPRRCVVYIRFGLLVMISSAEGGAVPTGR